MLMLLGSKYLITIVKNLIRDIYLGVKEHGSKNLILHRPCFKRLCNFMILTLGQVMVSAFGQNSSNFEITLLNNTL